MSIHLHRSNRTEHLVHQLAAVLTETLPKDPFQSAAVVVGSRGMERWIRHELATRMDIAAGLDFPFPRQALTGAARWLLDPQRRPQAPFWSSELLPRHELEAFSRETLGMRLVELLRQRGQQPELTDITRYLAGGSDAAPGQVSARELLFAHEVGDVLDRLMHDRTDTALQWARDPARAPVEHRWLALLLRDLQVHEHPHSPALLHEQLLQRGPVAPTGRSLCLFGLSTLGPGDRLRLQAIAQAVDCHLFVLAPSREWFGDHRTRGESRAAARRATTGVQREQLEQDLAHQNPVLASLGAPSRNLQDWLEDATYLGDHVPFTDPLEDAPDTLLHRLQSWVLAAGTIGDADVPFPVDDSMDFHATYGALRQCEVLRDLLLRRFEEDPTLEPRDVVVMTPDIQTYAPLLAAVFARSGQVQGAPSRSLPRIPVTVSDLGLRRTNPVAEALLTLLELARERLTATRLLDLLALEPVRLRWQLDEEDLADIREMVRDAGLRWGLDAQDRARVDQPALDQNTARFALERLALGALMADEDPLTVVPGPPGPTVPLDLANRSRIHRAGQLAGVLRTLNHHCQRLRQPASLERWRQRLTSALDDLTDTTDEATWLRTEVDSALDDLVQVGGHLQELPLTLDAILRYLQGSFELTQRGDRPITGAVQICAMEPMRSVPFRVVALVGLDDGAFPRSQNRRRWDPLEQRQKGERDRRDTDRHLFLEALLSARDHLLVLWSGRDVKKGDEQAAAVPVEELLETVGTLTGQTRDQLVHEHALQPWSASAFGDDPTSYDGGLARAVERLAAVRNGSRQAEPLGMAASAQAPLPEEEHPPQVLELSDLARALEQPHRLLLRDRLGLSVSWGTEALEDREPLELDNLQVWGLRARVLQHLLDAPPDQPRASLRQALLMRLRGEGVLPLEAGAERLLDKVVAEAAGLAGGLESVPGDPEDGLSLSVQLDDGLQLIGQVQRVRRLDDRLLLQWIHPSTSTNARVQLQAWVHLLGAVASGHPAHAARIVRRNCGSETQEVWLAPPAQPEQAREILTDLAAVWRLARRRPLPLFKRTSQAVGSLLHGLDRPLQSPDVQAELREKVSAAWLGESGPNGSRGDISDRWIETFFLGYDPTEHLDDTDEGGLVDLARRVWTRVSQAAEDGAKLAPTWQESP